MSAMKKETPEEYRKRERGGRVFLIIAVCLFFLFVAALLNH